MKTTNLTSPHAPPSDYVNYLRPTTYVYLSAIFYKVKVLHPVLTTKTVKRSKIFLVNIYYIRIYRKLSFFLFIFFINERSHLKKCVNLRILAESTCSIFLGFISVGASSQILIISLMLLKLIP